MKVLLHPSYFPSIAHFVAMVQARQVVLEVCDNYQKQTYRNRTYIYGPNGKQALTVPVKHAKNATGHQKHKKVQIENNFHWQKQHWKTLQTAYRTSPFFEFYEDELAPFFQKEHLFLMDLTKESIRLICSCLDLDFSYQTTTAYENTVTSAGLTDLRHLIDAKSTQPKDFDPYTQVFETKHGFLENLSILDLLFNEGPQTVLYLERQKCL
ncbi:WbqC family protein [Ascidiimonas aurantiaca]|uniref:WbqC family protein n=1 Tax=Ascidiimonas aurantiaca TaxID=1685432 RepID=UPI0030ED807E